MCGIVGAAALRNVTEILVEGLKRLEYRGYDSAGVAVLDPNGNLEVRKALGKVCVLQDLITNAPLNGSIGIAHTRWATHGKPSHINAHPHRSGRIAVVHNGIIENHQELRSEIKEQGYNFASETDTEVIAHLINHMMKQGLDLHAAVKKAIGRFEGAYALGVISTDEPGRLVAARSGSPLVIGVGIEEHFIASDPMALRQVTDRFIFLEDGDVADIKASGFSIENWAGDAVTRELEQLTDSSESIEKGQFRHYMLKEIYEQPQVISNTLQGRLGKHQVMEEVFGAHAKTIFEKVQSVQIVGCGTSFHAGMVAKYWFEEWACLPCNVEVASEFRYRKVVVPSNTLFITISQSGETADTLAALRASKALGYLAGLAVCNVASSSLCRESDLSLMMQAGPEIGVASTKAFTAQLVALQLLAIVLGRQRLGASKEKELIAALKQLPTMFEEVLALDDEIRQTSEAFAEKRHALFLGRGVQFPVAMEGALKLKEISYIHAEAYPAGELKHGPLAMVDRDMPIVAVAPNNVLLEKLKSNLEEVQARGGRLFVFADRNAGFSSEGDTQVINMPSVAESVAAMIYTLPLQLLSYHVAVLKGTDVDQPRNLAKSVTVE